MMNDVFNAIPMIPAEATVVGNHIANKKRRLIKTIVVMIRIRVIKVAISPYDARNVIKSLNQLPLKFILVRQMCLRTNRMI